MARFVVHKDEDVPVLVLVSVLVVVVAANAVCMFCEAEEPYATAPIDSTSTAIEQIAQHGLT
jgi:hypothetical protein